ncbi:MAG TPA: hypothetical protein VGI99_11395 [Gemmataceae bacterium]|jgi:hypothetical protein
MFSFSRWAVFVRFLAYAVLLYASFAHNVLCIPDSVESSGDGFRGRYIGYDSALVMNRMAHGPDGPIGLTIWNEAAGNELPYLSQYGLQGEMAARLQPDGWSVPEATAALACLSAALTALGLAAFFASLIGRLGIFATDFAIIMTAAMPCMLPLAPSLYWAPFLLFAPFLAVWFGYPWASCRVGRFALLLLVEASLIGVKCLCGYEHVTTAILAPIAALTYHIAVRGERSLNWLPKSAAIGIAGILGFALALAIHSLQIEQTTGQTGLSTIVQRAEHRTSANAGAELQYHLLAPEPSFLPEKLRLPVRAFANYFWLPAVATPRTWGPLSGTVSLGGICLMAIALAALGWSLRRRLPREVLALIPAAAVGFVAALSWQILAINHMVVHVHINLVVFAVSFLPCAFAGLGFALQRAAEWLGAQRALGVLLPCCVIAVVASNAVIVHWRAMERELADRRAAEAVEAMIRGDRLAGPPTVWKVNFSRRVPALPWGLPDGAESDPRLSPAARGHGQPAWLINIVAPTFGRTDAGPTVRIVAVRHGRAIPVQTAYRRLILVERVLAGKSSWNQATLAFTEGDQMPRLFLAAGANAESVTEVLWP